MWTCGIDMATQQATPAMTSKICSAPCDIPASSSREAVGVTAALRVRGRAAAQQQRESGAAPRDRRAPTPTCVARQPGRGDEMLHHRRPDDAGEIVAGGADRHGDPAPAFEPVGYVGDQRRESRRRAEADEHALQQREWTKFLVSGRGNIAGRQRRRPDEIAVATPRRSASRPRTTPPKAKADHGQRVGRRRGRARRRRNPPAPPAARRR